MSNKKLYLCVWDRSVPVEDPRHAEYVSSPLSNDIASLVTSLAQKNGSPVNEIRMFAFEKKSDWEKAKADAAGKYNWRLLDGPISRDNPHTGMGDRRHEALKEALASTWKAINHLHVMAGKDGIQEPRILKAYEWLKEAERLLNEEV